jgi:hypothetical protein
MNTSFDCVIERAFSTISDVTACRRSSHPREIAPSTVT